MVYQSSRISTPDRLLYPSFLSLKWPFRPQTGVNLQNELLRENTCIRFAALDSDSIVSDMVFAFITASSSNDHDSLRKM